MCFAFLLTIQHCIVWREKQYGPAPCCLGRREFTLMHHGTALVSPQTAQHHPGCTENPADVTAQHQPPQLSSSGETWAASSSSTARAGTAVYRSRVGTLEHSVCTKGARCRTRTQDRPLSLYSQDNALVLTHSTVQ